MKKKLTLILIGSIFCLLIGISFVNAESKTLSPNQYWGLGKNLDFADTLNFQITSSKGINVYIVDSYQLSIYQYDSQDTASGYYKEWIGVISLTQSFTAPEDDTYYVLMINPSDTLSTSVSVSASIDYYTPPETPEPEIEYVYRYITKTEYNWSFVILLVIAVIIVSALLIRKTKQFKREKQTSIPQTTPLLNDFVYCNQCSKKIGKNIQFCSSCGAKQ